MADNQSGMFVNFVMSLLLKKIVVPSNYHDRVSCVKEMLDDDVSGLVDSLTDFAVASACVDYEIQTDNEVLNEKLNDWLNNINSGYKGQIPRGIKALAEEYFKERWKSSSFPILKITEWKNINGLNFPTKMCFVDGESVYAQDKNKKNSLQTLLSYDYYLGSTKNTEDRLDKGVIITKPYGRWFEKYPNPFLVKRGVYHNWKIIQSIKKKETEILEQIIPYILLVKKGAPELMQSGIKKGYTEEELNSVIENLQELVDKLKSTNTSSESTIKTPIRATNFDEEIQHLIADLTNIFKVELFAEAEKNILTGLGFIDIAEAVSTSRRESILNPKVFIEEVRKGVEDFKKHILRELVAQIIENNKKNIKTINRSFYISSSPVKAFMTDEFKNHLRLLWERGQLSNKTYCEMVGEVEFENEVRLRTKELHDGTEVLMYPHFTRNQEQYVSAEETERKGEEKVDDKNGKPIPDDKQSQKEDYDVGAVNLEGAPYSSIKDLPSAVRKVLPIGLQRTFMNVFNNAYKKYDNDTMAFRVAWSVIKQIATKGKNGQWQRKKVKSGGKERSATLTKAMIEEAMEKEENRVIDEVTTADELEIATGKKKLLKHLLERMKEENNKE